MQINIERAEAVGDLVTVYGTVDGMSYTANCWLSHLTSLGSQDEQRAYMAELLAKQVPPAPVVLEMGATVHIERVVVDPAVVFAPAGPVVGL